MTATNNKQPLAPALYGANELKHTTPDFRIGAVISDGMWYSLTKWRKFAKVTEEEINDWIDRKLDEGVLLQSPTGAKSYRFPLQSIKDWYAEHGIEIGVQLLDSIFPPRIWDEMTETEGFLAAPLRKIGIVSFSCSSEVALEITEALKGIAKVRETMPGRYKAYCLSSSYVKEIVDGILKKHDPSVANHKIYSRALSKRREMVDFTPKFSRGIVTFYQQFAKTLLKKDMETIQIFIPESEDQNSQVLIWVISAIEKFDESSSVPFSGYLNSVLQRWPFDLPADTLGKELSSFQRSRSKALTAMKKTYADKKNFSNVEIATAMGMDQSKFNDLEEKHRVWMKSRNATTLTWDENSDEKMIESSNMSGDFTGPSASDIALAAKLSHCVVKAALNTGLYEDALSIITQIDASEINMNKIEEVSENFIQELGLTLGVEGGV